MENNNESVITCKVPNSPWKLEFNVKSNVPIDPNCLIGAIKRIEFYSSANQLIDIGIPRPIGLEGIENYNSDDDSDYVPEPDPESDSDLSDFDEDEFKKFSVHDNPNKKEDCSICARKLKRKVTTKCCHSFHKNCIRRWCRKNNNCPICRKPFE